MTRNYTYEYPKADVTTDAVVFGLDLDAGKLKLLLIERGREGEPFFGCWALPGGFLNPEGPTADKSLDECVLRELREETGLRLAFMEQLCTFGDLGRDPRGRVVTVAYWGIVRPQAVEVAAADDAKNLQWFDVDALPSLAFDHAQIVAVALQRLRSKLRWQPVGVWLLEEQFTLPELQRVYEVILGRPLHKASFKRKTAHHIERGVLVPTGGKRKPVAGRPATLYRYDPVAYEHLRRQGLDFEV